MSLLSFWYYTFCNALRPTNEIPFTCLVLEGHHKSQRYLSHINLHGYIPSGVSIEYRVITWPLKPKIEIGSLIISEVAVLFHTSAVHMSNSYFKLKSSNHNCHNDVLSTASVPPDTLMFYISPFVFVFCVLFSASISVIHLVLSFRSVVSIMICIDIMHNVDTVCLRRCVWPSLWACMCIQWVLPSSHHHPCWG